MNLLKQFRLLPIIQRAIILLSLSVLIISLSQPAFYCNGHKAMPSAYLFFMGWSGILGGGIPSCLPWLANPIYFISIYLIIRNKNYALYLSLLSVLIAFSFSFLDNIVTSESGSTSKIVSLEPGYYLWLTSFIILFLGCIICKILPQTPKGALK